MNWHEFMAYTDKDIFYIKTNNNMYKIIFYRHDIVMGNLYAFFDNVETGSNTQQTSIFSFIGNMNDIKKYLKTEHLKIFKKFCKLTKK